MAHPNDGMTILVQVLAVDTSTREVHVVDKHGGKIVATFRETPVIQQIPMTGETWSITMRGWHWMMGNRIEETEETSRTSNLSEGDLHLKVKTKLFLNDGLMGYATWEQFTVNGTTDHIVTLAAPPTHQKSVRVYRDDGSLVDPSTLTLTGTTLDVGTPPPAGKVTVYYSRI